MKFLFKLVKKEETSMIILKMTFFKKNIGNNYFIMTLYFVFKILLI